MFNKVMNVSFCVNACKGVCVYYVYVCVCVCVWGGGGGVLKSFTS